MSGLLYARHTRLLPIMLIVGAVIAYFNRKTGTV